jgi:C1A family cysteine protease
MSGFAGHYLEHRPHRALQALLRFLFLITILVLWYFLAVPLVMAGTAQPQWAPLSEDFIAWQGAQRQQQALGLDEAPWRAPMGFVPDPVAPPKSSVRAAAVTPAYAASFDLRSVGKVSSVKDQNPWGACWTFAAFASAESCLLPGESNDFSEDNMVLNSGFDNAPEGAYDHGGNSSKATAYLVRWSGPVTEAQDAYGDGYTPPGLSPVKHTQEVLYVPGSAGGAGTDAIKGALTTYGAVATSLYWDDAYYNGSTSAFYYGGSEFSNHAVTIVGWNDNYAASNFLSTPPGNGAWLVKNSWGAGWGLDGYFWASYYDSNCGTDNVFNAVYNGLQPTSNYSAVYYWDPLGRTGSIGFSKTTAWAANVFTAGSSQPIAAVGFFTPVPGTTYTVYAGNSLGSLAAKGSGSITTAGYHTVPFSSPYPVSPGATFVVAVRLTTPGTNYPIACEYSVPGVSSSASASPGQSYISGDGTAWDDLTTMDSTANACVKAYAQGSVTPGDDQQAPQTTASGWDDAWHKSPVLISFSAMDYGAGASGVDYTEYRVDDGSWARGTSVLLTTSGEFTVWFRSADKAGNVESEQSVTVKVDRVGPVAKAKNTSVRRYGVAKVNFYVTDNVSPLVRVNCKLTTLSGQLKGKITSSWGDANTWWYWKFTCNLPKGKYVVWVYVKDLAGNSQSKIGKAYLTVK